MLVFAKYGKAVLLEMSTNFFPCVDLSGFDSGFLKPTFLVQRRTAFRNGI